MLAAAAELLGGMQRHVRNFREALRTNWTAGPVSLVVSGLLGLSEHTQDEPG